MKRLLTAFICILVSVSCCLAEDAATEAIEHDTWYFTIDYNNPKRIVGFGGAALPKEWYSQDFDHEIRDLCRRVLKEDPQTTIGLMFVDEIRMSEIHYFKSMLSEFGYTNRLPITVNTEGESYHLRFFKEEKKFDDLTLFISAINSADTIKFKTEGKGNWHSLRITDQNEINKMAELLRNVEWPLCDYCLCSGYEVMHFFSNKTEVADITPIHGNQLRIHWPEGGGDYKVSPELWEQVSDLFKHYKANQLVDPIVKTSIDEVEAQGTQGHQ